MDLPARDFKQIVGFASTDQQGKPRNIDAAPSG